MSAVDSVPELADVLRARRRIAPHLARTPLRNYPLLDDLLGAEVIEGGADFNDAVEFCEAEAARRGGRYVHSGNEPLLIAGVARDPWSSSASWPG